VSHDGIRPSPIVETHHVPNVPTVFHAMTGQTIRVSRDGIRLIGRCQALAACSEAPVLLADEAMSVLGQTGSPPQWQESIAAGPHVRHRDVMRGA
jgi:hypothetical protein